MIISEGRIWEPRARALLKGTRSQLSEDSMAFLRQLQADLQTLSQRALVTHDEVASGLWRQLLQRSAEDSQALPKNYEVKFHAPEQVRIVGGYAIGTAVATESPMVDIAIELPRKTFLEKDYLDGRYHVKRLLYLVEVVRQLQERHPHLEVTFETSPAITLTGDSLLAAALQKPVALLRTARVGCCIRILPALRRDQFPRLKLHPERCYWRVWRDLPGSAETLRLIALYNESIRKDWMILADDEYLASVAQQCAVFADVVLLLKVWVMNRQLGALDPEESLQSLVSGHELAMQVAHLIHQNSLPIRTASLEQLTLAAFRALQSRVPEGGSVLAVELAAALRSFASRLRDVDAVGGLYSTLLGCSVEPLAQFDSVILVARKRASSTNPETALVGSIERSWVKNLLKTLRQAFGDRVQHIGLLPPLKTASSTSALRIGFKWHDHNLFRLVDREPDEGFWGTERIEWRRFHTGEVTPCLVWATSSLERFQVPQRILDAVLKQYEGLSILANTLWLLEETFLPSLWVREHDSLHKWRYVRESRSLALYEARCSVLGHAYRALCQLLMDTSGPAALSKMLPLRVHAVHVPASGGQWLRCTGVEWPELDESIREPWTSSYRLVAYVEMESTHLWPDKVQFPDAAHAVRVAFAIALYRAMERVIQNNPDRSPLPVRFMRVSRRGELHLLFGAFPVCLQIRSAAEVAAELANIRLHAQLASIASRFPAFGSTARLVKRFLAAHSLLDPDGIDGLSPVAVEVLVSRLFTEPLPMANHPATAWGGLVRFLHLIAKHDAAASEALVIVVPELEQEESPWYPETAQDETQMRSMPPRLCLCTSSDPSGTFLTQQVAGEIVHRLRLVSRAALQHLEREIQQGACLELEQLGAVFRSAPLEAFCDLVIELEPEVVPAKQPHTETISIDEAQDTAPKSARFVNVDRDGKNRLLVGVDPVAAYVKWLREMFGSVMVFVRDIYGSCSIGGIWRRHANLEMRFDGNQLSYRRTFAHKASKTANLLEWNVPEMLQDMRRIGCGLVREIRLCHLPSTQSSRS